MSRKSVPSKNNQSKASREKKPLSWKLRLLLMSFSVFLMLALEGLLRLFGFGGLVPLWKEIPLDAPLTGSIFQTDQTAISAFFSVPTANDSARQGSMRNQRVRMPKPANVLRIAIAGESSVEGYPYPRQLSFPSFLQTYLQAFYPDHEVQVVNLGVTAIASFPVRVIAQQTMDTLDLDLLIVYTGHNEFFGAFGVASLKFGGGTLFGQKILYALRSLALSQAVGSSIEKLKQHGKKSSSEKPAMIQIMAGIDNVEPDGKLHHRAGKIFYGNLKGIIHDAKRRNVPVLLSTVITNEANLQPVRFFNASLNENVRLFNPADLAALSEQKMGELLGRLNELSTKYPQHALLPYQRGQLYARLGQSEMAQKEFIRARDLDAMPWRAPSLYQSPHTASRRLGKCFAV